MNNKRKFLIVTGSRAEFGLMRNLIKKFSKDDDIDLKLVVTGSHLSPMYGETVNEIVQEGFEIHSKINLNLSNDSALDIAVATSIGIKSFSKLIYQLNPDLIIILGDRYEILSVVLPACFLNVPIAHIHGGEKTEGSIDESIRHAITKFSHLHFVANEEYRNRVVQLGENPKRVFNVGGLGIDAIHKLNYLSKSELTERLGIKLRKKNLLVTYHPETLDNKLSKKGIKELLKSLNKLKETSLIFTLPNADPNNSYIAKRISNFVKRNPNAYLFNSLGQLNYFSLIKFCDGVIGNSSSGLLEVPSFKKATINIGNRQKGRLKAKSVINCESIEENITKSINEIYSKRFQKILKNVKNPYGEKGASEKIKRIIKKNDLKNLIKKSFYDLKKIDDKF
tara:strand:+ start:5176 stop:6357 length:1182 start_codon:yes stop_codon:yes gene_type:complete